MKLKVYAIVAAFILISAKSTFAQEINPRIVSVKGNDVYQSTLTACKAFGLDSLIKTGMRVGILVNSDFEFKGAYTNPDITLAVVKMCVDAGVSEVVALQNIKQEYWVRSTLYGEHTDILAKVRNITQNTFPSVFDSANFVKFSTYPGAPNLKNLEMVKEIFEVDFFINIPIAKHHTTTILTNSMKNLMGLNTRAFNVSFHLNGPKRNDPEFLATCIAELNLVRKPDLIVSDVTHSIITNGPNGPGETVSPERVVVGIDPVAIDTYSAMLIGFDPSRILSIQIGHRLGLGEKNPNKFVVEDIILD